MLFKYFMHWHKYSPSFELQCIILTASRNTNMLSLVDIWATSATHLSHYICSFMHTSKSVETKIVRFDRMKIRKVFVLN